MSMTPPTVLLDRSFLEALVDRDHTQHAETRACYERLVDDYQAHHIRVRARLDHLIDVDRKRHAELFAPVEVIHVARQYRRQAVRLAGRLGDDYEPDLAVTLVVMRRESIERIATYHPYFDTLDVTVECRSPVAHDSN
jgi:hypothetical protein